MPRMCSISNVGCKVFLPERYIEPTVHTFYSGPSSIDAATIVFRYAVNFGEYTLACVKRYPDHLFGSLNTPAAFTDARTQDHLLIGNHDYPTKGSKQAYRIIFVLSASRLALPG